MQKWIFALISLYSAPSFSQILVDDSWGSTSRHKFESLDSGESLKSKKKVGLQTTLAGATGLAGLNLDINFTKDFALSFGLGISRGFQSFNLHIKKSLGGESLVPYFAAGYSRWFSQSEGEVGKTSPPILSNKFLNDKEKRTGQFSENIIYPGLGLQYLILDGEWQGLGFFAEADMLIDLDDFLAGGTGGLGAIYYF